MSLSPLSFTLFPYTTLFRSSGAYLSSSWESSFHRFRCATVKRILTCPNFPSPSISVTRNSASLSLSSSSELSSGTIRSEEHTSELQSRGHLVCRLLLEKKKHQ